MVLPFVKNTDIFVSPGDPIQGHAPTCFASANNNSGKGWPAGQQADRCPVGGNTPPGVTVIGTSIVDQQVPRLSYTVNAAVIPRARNILDITVGGIHVISQTNLENVSGTIMITGLVGNLECLNGQSLGTGIRNSSHRSTNAVTRDPANQVQYVGENTDGTANPLYAVNYAQVTQPGANIFELCRTTPSSAYPFIVYHSTARWNEGDNYGMADGSAKHRRFAATLASNNFMWGAKMYTATGQQILDPITGLPVTQ